MSFRHLASLSGKDVGAQRVHRAARHHTTLFMCSRLAAAPKTTRLGTPRAPGPGPAAGGAEHARHQQPGALRPPGAPSGDTGGVCGGGRRVTCRRVPARLRVSRPPARDVLFQVSRPLSCPPQALLAGAPCGDDAHRSRPLPSVRDRSEPAAARTGRPPRGQPAPGPRPSSSRHACPRPKPGKCFWNCVCPLKPHDSPCAEYRTGAK